MNTSLCIYTHSLIDGHLDWFHNLAIVSSAAVYRCLYGMLTLIPLGVYLVVVEQNNMGILVLAFQGSSYNTDFHSGWTNLHSTKCIYLCTPSSSTFFLVFVLVTILTRVRYNLNVVLICISLFSDDMILYLKDFKDSSRRLLDPINTFSKIAG
jgi:hypothetical protein